MKFQIEANKIGTSENKINNVDLNNASAISLLATENIRRPLHTLYVNLPRGF